MNIDKNQILDMLRGQGKNDEATQASTELPDQVDTDAHADLLSKFGVNPAELISKFAGGGGGGAGGGDGGGGALGDVLGKL